MLALILTAALSLGQVATPAEIESLTLEPAPGTTFELGRGSYAGQLEITAHPDGLAVVETTTLENYLLGITEVPTSWPDETLAAQAVAARTYLAWTLARGRTSTGSRYGYDICASQFCQVYRGPGGAADTWAEAVLRTEGEILVHDGVPAQALYSSSAGTRTRAVQDVFGGDPKPYLQPVDSPELDVTPYRRWVLEVTADTFSRVFARGGYVFGGVITDVAMRSPGEGAGQVAVEVLTEQGVTVVPITRFRAVFNVYGPDLYPGLFPAARPSGGRWPQTILSYTFDVGYSPPTPHDNPLLPPGDAGTPGMMTVTGEGWGHGVGMSQWGAMAMGSAGASYRSILDHYYGLEAVPGGDALPATVKVGLLIARPQIELRANGAFDLVTSEHGTVAVGPGQWLIRRFGDGLIVIAPEGTSYDSPLLRRQRFRPR